MTPALRLALAAAAAIALGACSSNPNDLPVTNPFKSGKSERELRLEADGLYKLARRSLDSADYQGAIQRYDQIQLKYPFTDYATQAQLESIYAKYRAYDSDGALTTADRFLKEHPRHPSVDYVYYLRGLINFQRGESAFEWLVDSSRQDVGFARNAFDDFALLAQKYPNSRYVADARDRMVYLRNRIASHELSVVRYYIRRGAWIAAARRAEKIVQDYPGAPATIEALALLEKCYREAGLDDQAQEVARVRAANPQPVVLAEGVQKTLRYRFSYPKDPIPAAPPAGDFVIRPGATIREVTSTPQPVGGEAPQISPTSATPQQTPPPPQPVPNPDDKTPPN